ncbi:MAG: exonuclease domain-containing protein [Sulfuricurvum sp.]
MSSGTILLLTVFIVFIIIKMSKFIKEDYDNLSLPIKKSVDSPPKINPRIYHDNSMNKIRGYDSLGITLGMSINRLSDQYRKSVSTVTTKKIDIGIPKRNITKPEHIKKFQYYTVIDFETTGLNPNDSEIIEIGAVKLHWDTLEPNNTFHSFVRPDNPIPKRITSINNITNEMVDNAPHISKVIVELIDFIGNDCIIAHNAPFDMKFLVSAAQSNGVEIRAKGYICTLKMARSLLALQNHKLPTVAKHFGIEFNPHRAVDDCIATGYVFSEMCKIIESR